MHREGVDQARFLCAIERLRSGLPPEGAAAEVSVGMDELIKSVAAFLDGEAHATRGYAVIGNYGSGKSHALTTLRDLALERNFATCWLTVDSTDSALNHPQRWIGDLLRTVETPDHDAGYVALLTRVLENDDFTGALPMVVAATLNTGVGVDAAIRGATASYVMEKRLSAPNAIHDFVVRDHLVRLLGGEGLVGVPGTATYRAAAYRLLALANQIMQIVGYAGLVIVIDEVESVFTKLANRLSRQGAYRTLAALLYGIDTPNLRVALAMTPDTLELFDEQLGLYASFIECLGCEPVRQLRQQLRTLPIWRCVPLDETRVGEVLNRIRALYGRTYRHAALGSNSAWSAKVNEIRHRHPPIRLAIRDGVDFLDRARLGIE